MVKAVILNMGGVVRDSRITVPVSFKTAFGALGLELDFKNEDIWRLKGIAAFNRIERAASALYSIKEAGEDLGALLQKDTVQRITALEDRYRIEKEDLDFLIKTYRQAFFESEENLKIPPVRNAVEAIKLIRSMELKIGAFSTAPKSFNEQWMRTAGIRQYFDVVHCEEEREIKPYTEHLLEICRALGVKPEETIYVGDTEGDIISGKGAGCQSAAVLTGMGIKEGLAKATPDGIYSDLYEFAKKLKK